jgi:hypothetical protein
MTGLIECGKDSLQQLGSGRTFRQAITDAEKLIMSVPQVECPVKHHFSNGVYAREIFMPKDTVVTGKIHKTEHLCILNGDIEIADGNKVKRYTGYHVFNSLPGIKRILIVHEDTWFTTIHVTNETDLEKLEAEMVVNTFDEFDNIKKFEVLP